MRDSIEMRREMAREIFIRAHSEAELINTNECFNVYFIFSANTCSTNWTMQSSIREHFSCVLFTLSCPNDATVVADCHWCWLLLLMPYRWWWCNIAIQCIQHTVHSLSLVSWCFDSSCILSDLNVTTLASNSHLPLEHHPYGWRAHAIYSKTKHKHRTTTVS